LETPAKTLKIFYLCVNFSAVFPIFFFPRIFATAQNRKKNLLKVFKNKLVAGLKKIF